MFRPVPTEADFTALEDEELARWAEHRVFERSVELRAGAEPWVFYEGPPTANGRPGLHHVWARVYKDLFCRYRTMRGYAVPRKAGWDTHGLPVEVEVEKQLGITAKRQIEDEVGIAEFTRLCRESVRNYVDEWKTLTERIGYWIDIDDAYWTFSPEYVESVWANLKSLWDQGLLYEDIKVVPVLPPLRHGPEQPRAGPARRLPRGRGRVGLRAAPADRRRGRGRRPAGRARPRHAGGPRPGGLDDHAVDPAVQHRRRRRPRPRVRAWSGDARSWPPPWCDAGLRRGRGGRRHRARARRWWDCTTAARSTTSSPGPADAGRVRLAGGGRRLRRGRRGDRHRPPGPGLRRGRPPGGPATTACPPSTRWVPTAGSPTPCPGWRARPCGTPTATVNDRLEAAGLLLRRAPVRPPLPPLLAVRHRRSSTGASRAGTSGPRTARPSWWRRTRPIGWHPEHIRDGRMGEWLANNVDWALSRDRFWGTPLPVWRCDEGHTRCVGSLAELSELAGARRHRRRSPPPGHRRGHHPLPRVPAGGDAADATGRAGHRRLVRLGVDADGPVGLPRRARLGRAVRLPGRLHLRGHRPDPRLVLLAAGRQHPGAGRHPVPQRAVPGSHRRRRRPQDVQERRQRHRPVGDPHHPGRRPAALVDVLAGVALDARPGSASRSSTPPCGTRC